MTIYNTEVREEVKVKCQECGEVSFAASEYAECECGGQAINIKPFAVFESPYEVELGLV